MMMLLVGLDKVVVALMALKVTKTETRPREREKKKVVGQSRIVRRCNGPPVM